MHLEASKFVKQKLLELKEVNSSTVIVGDVRTVLSVMHRMYTERSTRQFEHITNQLDLTVTISILYPTTGKESAHFPQTRKRHSSRHTMH